MEKIIINQHIYLSESPLFKNCFLAFTTITGRNNLLGMLKRNPPGADDFVRGGSVDEEFKKAIDGLGGWQAVEAAIGAHFKAPGEPSPKPVVEEKPVTPQAIIKPIQTNLFGE